MAILLNHEVVTAVPGRLPDFGFVDEMGWLMVWGTVLLFVDAIAIILLYERLGTWLRRWPAARSLISLAVFLSVDQTGFFLALRLDRKTTRLNSSHSSQSRTPSS